MKKFLALALAICMIFTLCACGQDEPTKESDNTKSTTAPTSDEGDIVIGVSIPLTGPLAESGEMAVKAMDLFCEQINAAGGVNGRTVRYEVLDDKMDPTEASMVAQRFIENDEIICVVGSLTSGSPPHLQRGRHGCHLPHRQQQRACKLPRLHQNRYGRKP